VDLKLRDKIALVTGSGSPIGFGRAIALRLAEEGCDLACADLNPAWAEETAGMVEALGRPKPTGTWISA
jgi:meso-butanediol dehydrogenase/(S,S)-butanediol dehydrogenase/diacetyl reductase